MVHCAPNTALTFLVSFTRIHAQFFIDNKKTNVKREADKVKEKGNEI